MVRTSPSRPRRVSPSPSPGARCVAVAVGRRPAAPAAADRRVGAGPTRPPTSRRWPATDRRPLPGAGSPYAAGNRGLDVRSPRPAPPVVRVRGRRGASSPVRSPAPCTSRCSTPTACARATRFLAAIAGRAWASTVAPGRSRSACAGPIFHFGVRDADGTYLDPEALFGAGRRAHLVRRARRGRRRRSPTPPSAARAPVERAGSVGSVRRRRAAAHGSRLPGSRGGHEAAGRVGPGVAGRT